MITKSLQWFESEGYERLGYRLSRTRSGHWKVLDPAGKLVTVLGSTNSDHRGWLNERARLRRHQRDREAAARRIKPSTRPETPTQAGEWARVKSRYLQAGLCHKCSAQAAYANQQGTGGWFGIHPPCTGCAEIVELFPYPTINPAWRSVVRKRI